MIFIFISGDEKVFGKHFMKVREDVKNDFVVYLYKECTVVSTLKSIFERSKLLIIIAPSTPLSYSMIIGNSYSTRGLCPRCSIELGRNLHSTHIVLNKYLIVHLCSHLRFCWFETTINNIINIYLHYSNKSVIWNYFDVSWHIFLVQKC